ncbi:hypothetical protein TIFTF001_041147 [Ficus carica]|uniref:Uncharacterized protein n=1 Tax=Ficus carica TaxID=3494 RepID=A0AA87Z2L5_FICCA|nr:hypothetical protein TIFTF001_041147 [Ficus carica]
MCDSWWLWQRIDNGYPQTLRVTGVLEFVGRCEGSGSMHCCDGGWTAVDGWQENGREQFFDRVAGVFTFGLTRKGEEWGMLGFLFE